MLNDNMDKIQLKWQKDLESYFPIYNSFILDGYIEDIQPYEEDGKINYCKVYDFIEKTYGQNGRLGFNKRIILYDPTESEEKRFYICDDDYDVVNVEDPDNNEQHKTKHQYASRVSQRFYDIVNSDDFNELLINHNSSGASLDFAQLHYSVTEGSGRIHLLDIPDKLQGMFRTLFFDTRESGEPDGYIFIIKMASRLLSHNGGNNLSADELMIFRQLFNVVQSIDLINSRNTSQSKNKIFILANDAKDLPTWFTDNQNNSSIKTLTVTKPSEENRIAVFNEMIEDRVFSTEFINAYQRIVELSGGNLKNNQIIKKFLAYTNDFSMNMLKRYGEFLKVSPLNNPEKIGFSLTIFNSGDMTNPWENDDIIKEMLNLRPRIEEKIQGQSGALEMLQNILSRSVTGFDRAENPNAPRAVLFLAGPTGTGKTEVCKQIAECVFGSEDRIVRFDMSEYGQEESDQKLFGAPPGYVGYEEGGKLTNAVKKEPFSLILFDEIEKAHNSILDKFLQILGDGRLTDGKGETIRFTDCIIAITSNAGVDSFDGMDQSDMDKLMNGDKRPEKEMNIELVESLENQGTHDDEIYDLVKEHLRYNVKAYFNCKLRRPELYGRVEDAIVYYNYIGKDAVPKICNSKIKEVIKSAKDALPNTNISCPESVKSKVYDFCLNSNVRSMGARGIIKKTGMLFTGSLANFVSDYYAERDGKSKNDLTGQTITCSCSAEQVRSVNDINWSIS